MDSVIETTRRNLPHWRRGGAIYWVCFRLADALPQPKLRAWQDARDAWLEMHPKPWDEGVWDEYNRRFTEQMETWLDRGMGCCALGRPDVRSVVIDCLLRFEGDRLRLHSAVVMPNHVHAIMEPSSGLQLSSLLKGIKGASARAGNRILGTSGHRFWMDESYDHIVRSPEQYEHFKKYVIDNPTKARLNPSQYWLFEQPDYSFSLRESC